MALAAEIMRGGQSAGSAALFGGEASSTVTAAGTVIGDATDLIKSINFVGTVAASTGVQLPLLMPGESVMVYNGGANSLKVYPGASTVQINQLSVGTAMSLGTNTLCNYVGYSATRVFAQLSA